MTLTPRDSGWIEVICGSMFSGKTEELIRRLKRAEIAQMKVEIYKPKIDSRYSVEHIVSHNQLKMKSIMVNTALDILEQSKNADVVGIDEAQFFGDDLVHVCHTLAKNKKRVVIAGLDTDYKGNPFGPMPNIMCEADYLDKLRAICVQCGNPATYSQRLTLDDNQVVIGETDVYEARCRNCYLSPEDES